MCGVFGYIGAPAPVIPRVASALRVMEYRGYDSWGIGWAQDQSIGLVKQTGRVPTELADDVSAAMALGHTRWATHGVVSDQNAHPHTDALNQVAVVHNGLIENADALKAEYLEHIEFRSHTDSEVVPHLIRHFLNEGTTFPEAVKQTFLLLKGSSAIVAMEGDSEMIAAITARSPLRLGRRPDGWELASDPMACAGSCQEIAVVPDNHLVVLTKGVAHLLDINHETEVAISWEPTPEEVQASRGKFPHFTIKEIHDQLEVMRDLSARVNETEPLAAAIQRHHHIILTGCGSALYAATLGAGWLQRACDAWVDVVPASEIGAHTRNMGADTLVIAFTQSGETADVVDAVQTAREWGASIATVINTESSTVARVADLVLPIAAGVERSVLATKSFLAMALRIHQTTTVIAGQNHLNIDETIASIEAILADDSIAALARDVAQSQSMVVLGKDMGHAVAQEAALKIKEGAYLHAEAFLTGELKHGPLALVEHGTPCLILATTLDEYASARRAAAEVTSRGGRVIGIGPWADGECYSTIRVEADSPLASLVHLVAAQKLAYHIATERGVDPDFPRNLAKSVTVR